MSKKDVQQIRALVQSATRPEVVIPLVLKADIQSRIEELEKQLIDIRKDGLTSLAGNPEAEPIATEIEALIEQAKASTIEVLIRGLPRREWSDLKEKHPPKDPTMYLYDTAIFNDAIPACWVEPEIDDETRDKLLDGITGGQWDRLCAAVQSVNGDVSVPFSALASRVRRGSVASEKSPEPTA